MLEVLSASNATWSDVALLQYICDETTHILRRGDSIVSVDYQCGCSKSMLPGIIGLSALPINRTLETASVCRVLYEKASHENARQKRPASSVGLCFVVVRDATKYTESVQKLLMPHANALHALPACTVKNVLTVCGCSAGWSPKGYFHRKFNPFASTHKHTNRLIVTLGIVAVLGPVDVIYAKAATLRGVSRILYPRNISDGRGVKWRPAQEFFETEDSDESVDHKGLSTDSDDSEESKDFKDSNSEDSDSSEGVQNLKHSRRPRTTSSQHLHHSRG